MKRFMLSIITLVLFLIWTGVGFGKKPKPVTKEEIEKGKKLWNLHCFPCHKINGKGGNTGPDHSFIGAKYSRKKIRAIIKNPSRQGKTKMVNRFPNSIANPVSAYLSTLK